jgi:hypothetical protein
VLKFSSRASFVAITFHSINDFSLSTLHFSLL